MIHAGILGATGYVGLELTRLLAGHPEAEISVVSSQSYAGQRIEDVYPSLRGCVSMKLADVDLKSLAEKSDVVFTALPHGAACDAVSELVSHGVKVIDLSADFRYNDEKIYSEWYGLEHKNPALMKEAVYGLPELYRESIKKSRLVANPGCYTTCSILPIYPLLEKKLIKPEHIIIDAKSGVSGAGAKPSANTAFCEVDESLKAYSVASHRHTSEIEQELSIAAGQEITISFTPHLLPIKRGILSTIYVDLAPGVGEQELAEAYERYLDEPFVNVYKHGDLPHIKHIAGSNFCSIGYQIDKRVGRAVIVSCLDNMVKGAAGQAVQNMNILFGLSESAGLSGPGLFL